MLAVGYSKGGHSGWCPHKSYLRLWFPFKSERTNDIELDGCVSSLVFHPFEPMSFVAGTFNGQLLFYDLEKQNPLMSFSSVDEYEHREAVTGLHFAVDPFGVPKLYSISTDGKVLQWTHSALAFPLRGFLLKMKSDLLGGLCMGIPYGDYSSIIVGTEAGKLL